MLKTYWEETPSTRVTKKKKALTKPSLSARSANREPQKKGSEGGGSIIPREMKKRGSRFGEALKSGDQNPRTRVARNLESTGWSLKKKNRGRSRPQIGNQTNIGRPRRIGNMTPKNPEKVETGDSIFTPASAIN